MAGSSRKRTSKQLLYFFYSVTILFFLLMATLEYFRIIRVTNQLARREAETLIQHVQTSIDAATYSESVIRENVTDRLYSVAYLIREQAETNKNLDLTESAYLAEVDRIDIFDKAGRWEKGNLYKDKIEFPGKIENLNLKDDWEKTVGIFRADIESEQYYGVAINFKNQGILLVSINAAELLALRQNVGLGALLEDLDFHSNVLYAILDSPEGILAATPDLPQWIEPVYDYPQPDEYITAVLDIKSTNSPDGKIFEALAFYDEINSIYLRLGIKNDELNKILSQNSLTLLIRTLSILLVSTLVFILLIQRQNMRLIEEQRSRIQKEVQILEADRNTRKRLAAMGELAGGVAHEIRNPLNTVGMAAQRLEHEFQPGEDKDGYKQLIHSLKNETARIGRIIADFLDYARPPKANKQNQNLVSALQQVLDTFETMAVAKNVKFQYVTDDKIDFSFDADQIRQALLNLLKNALDELSDQNGVIKTVINANKEFVFIDVADNGPGVEPGQLERIFDLYYTSKADGMGIGLPTVHRIAVEHGGRVEYSDTPGGGATFRMILKKDK